LAEVPVEVAVLEPAIVEPPPLEAVLPPAPPARWQYEPPEFEIDEAVTDEFPAVSASAVPVAVLSDDHEEDETFAGLEPAANHNIVPPMTGSSFDAALESLQRRMERANLSIDFVRSLLIVDNVIDVGEAAMRWAGMPNKHERSLTSEVFFALAEWGFLAPRADGRYRVLHAADDDPVV
jgi:hypothetical protein